ncbi:CAAX prenyl protease-like protein [Diaminobutyricimonas aerilata]|uniref:CAAX prenyl protease-like protein n=1 Tax=Diaminobutyricimonas aerilata TaxID=1162967 RepID=A0A2M9CLM9_9MICO|nr:CPBP family intramembrane glutamic endopeptidase [Diaminobutyricimonas aerilata]PJJ72804.1 CAAX prenyl protease-like protein [Diaminobutyricimonas aerilata]
MTRHIVHAPRRRIRLFLLLAFGLSWIPWTVLGVLRVDVTSGAVQLVFGLAAAGPSLAALAMWLNDPVKRARRTVRPSRWLPLAVVLGVAPALATALVFHPAPGIAAHAGDMVASLGGPLVVLGFVLLAGPIAEEFGWRGWLQPRLRATRGRLSTALVVGAIWAVWHVPLFALEGTGQSRMPLEEVAVFFVSFLPLSVIALAVSERWRGGAWAAVALHAGVNAADGLLPTSGLGGALLQLLLTTAVAAVVLATWREAEPPSTTSWTRPSRRATG